MTKIEWTEATWNPIRARNKETGGEGHYCVHKTDGCKNCYAETWQKRFNNPVRFGRQYRDDVFLFLKNETQPLSWRKPRMVFVCSMTDMFLKDHYHAWLSKIWAVMALCPQHTFQVLTKRTERMRDFICGIQDLDENLEQVCDAAIAMTSNLDAGTKVWTAQWPLENVWVGTSVARQKDVDPMVRPLMQTPAAVRFVSAEPLLEPLDLTKYVFNRRQVVRDAMYGPAKMNWDQADAIIMQPLDWLIVGGESGPHHRPMRAGWARSLHDQCADADTSFFMKQMAGRSKAECQNIPEDLLVREYPGRYRHV